MAAEASWPVIKDCFFSGGPGMAAEASWPVIGVAWNGRGGFVASSLLPGLSLAFPWTTWKSLKLA